jgi:hypothetical protein
MTESTRKRGRPRRNGPDEIWVSVPLPPWVVEHIDEQDGARGRFVARLFLERLAVSSGDLDLITKLCKTLYG